MTPRAQLEELIMAEMNQPVSSAAMAMAMAIRDRHRTAAQAIIFYGSCLRQPEQALSDSLMDFYVVVDSYKIAYSRFWQRLANALLPPNVFYIELPWQTHTLRAKYAIISLDQFRRGVSSAAINVSLWARFCQPTRLPWARDTKQTQAIVNACGEAVCTMLEKTRSLLPESASPRDLWTRGFQETYRAELRAEGQVRAEKIYIADADRYDRMTPLVVMILASKERISLERAMQAWRFRRILGKTLNVARLLKAIFTFENGLDYILWKVRRHTGVVVSITPWQRRHPLLAAPGLALKLYRRGAFR